MKSSSLKKVYHTGMRYVQRAMIARSCGDEKAALKYMEKFQTLCDFAETGLENVPEARDGQIAEQIEKMNGGRLVLSGHIPGVLKSKDADSLRSVKSAVDVINRSCQVYSQCMELHIKPPEVVEESVEIMASVSNNEIPLSTVRCSIMNIGGVVKKGVTYTVKCYSISEAEEPKESPVFTGGPTNFSINWNILKRSNADYMARIVAKKSLGFEVTMHEKGIFSDSHYVVGRVRVPLSLLSNQSLVSKTYPLEPEPGAPKGEQFSIAIVLEANSPLVAAAFGLTKVPYTRVKQGSAPQQYKLPKPKTTANQKTDNNEEKNLKQNKTPKGDAPIAEKHPTASQGDKSPKLKQMNELTKAEMAEIIKKLPKIEGITFRVLDDWELERWMSNHVLKQLFEETKQAVSAFQSQGVEPPEKLMHMLSVVREKISQNANDIKSKKITTLQYFEKLSAQVKADEKEAKKKGVDTPSGALLIHRAKVMREEYALATAKKGK